MASYTFQKRKRSIDLIPDKSVEMELAAPKLVPNNQSIVAEFDVNNGTNTPLKFRRSFIHHDYVRRSLVRRGGGGDGNSAYGWGSSSQGGGWGTASEAPPTPETVTVTVIPPPVTWGTTVTIVNTKIPPPETDTVTLTTTKVGSPPPQELKPSLRPLSRKLDR
jgi:hypothetical protein